MKEVKGYEVSAKLARKGNGALGKGHVSHVSGGQTHRKEHFNGSNGTAASG